jgi:hypothetical protein
LLSSSQLLTRSASDSEGEALPIRRYTRPFYAYSHKRVLSRRRNLKLRSLNRGYGSFEGGDEMHVVGMPFINGYCTANRIARLLLDDCVYFVILCAR